MSRNAVLQSSVQARHLKPTSKAKWAAVITKAYKLEMGGNKITCMVMCTSEKVILLPPRKKVVGASEQTSGQPISKAAWICNV